MPSMGIYGCLWVSMAAHGVKLAYASQRFFYRGRPWYQVRVFVVKSVLYMHAIAMYTAFFQRGIWFRKHHIFSCVLHGWLLMRVWGALSVRVGFSTDTVTWLVRSMVHSTSVKSRPIKFVFENSAHMTQGALRTMQSKRYTILNKQYLRK